MTDFNWTKAEEIADWLLVIETRLHRTPCGRFVHLSYTDNTGSLKLSDWQRKYHHILSGEEYILVTDNTTGDLLYAVNVTGDAVLTAIYELMKLLSAKF